MENSIITSVISLMKKALAQNVAQTIVLSNSYVTRDRRGRVESTRVVLNAKNFSAEMEDEEARFASSAPTNNPAACAIAREIAQTVADARGLSVTENVSGQRTYFNTAPTSADIASL